MYARVYQSHRIEQTGVGGVYQSHRIEQTDVCWGMSNNYSHKIEQTGVCWGMIYIVYMYISIHSKPTPLTIVEY